MFLDSEKGRRIQLLLRELNRGLYEKEAVVALALLAAVAGEGVFLLGPPGVAKSMIARRLKLAFREGESFEYLMSRFSTPDEIFGPVSIARLKDEDRYERLTEGYLPSASVVFLDEIWKAGPGIQNALLTVLNEKIYRNGRHTLHLPLKGFIAASNELPAAGEGLEALWDRFLLRLFVTGIVRNDLFDAMITDVTPAEPQIAEDLPVTDEELARWRSGIDRVEVPAEVLTFVHRLREGLRNPAPTADALHETPELYVSDRRWKKLIHLLRTAAFLCGRSAVSLSDGLLSLHTLWSAPEERSRLSALLVQAQAGTWEDELHLTRLQDRTNALREQLQQTAHATRMATVRPKVVQTFFYQLQGVRLAQKMFVYQSEYDRLTPGRPEPFVLVNDRQKTGAQILRRYDKNRHPGTFSKDLLQVEAGEGCVVVNGKRYPLLLDEAASSAPTQDAPAPSLAPEWQELLVRLQQEAVDARAAWAQIQQREAACAAEHLFLDEELRRLQEQAFRAVNLSLARAENALNELAHATVRHD